MAEKKLFTVKRKLASRLDLPRDVVLDLPRITIVGNIQVYVENHKGILYYQEDCIQLGFTHGQLSIQGRSLTVRMVGNEEIFIDGEIGSIRFEVSS